MDLPFSGYKLPSQVKLDSFHVILSSITKRNTEKVSKIFNLRH